MKNNKSGFYIEENGAMVITGARIYKLSFIEKSLCNILSFIKQVRTK